MIKNQERKPKMQEVQKYKDVFDREGCDATEQLLGSLLELEKKVKAYGSVEQRASVNELMPVFAAMYAHEKYGMVFMRYELAKLRKFCEQYFPKLHVYALKHQEPDVHGGTIWRFYIAIISGKKEVQEVNDRLTTIEEAYGDIKNNNNEANNARAVIAEKQRALDYLRNKRKMSGSGIQ